MSKLCVLYLYKGHYKEIIGINDLKLIICQISTTEEIVSKIIDEHNRGNLDIVIFNSSITNHSTVRLLLNNELLNNIKKFVIASDQEVDEKWHDMVDQNPNKLLYIRRFFLEVHLKGLVEKYLEGDLESGTYGLNSESSNQIEFHSDNSINLYNKFIELSEYLGGWVNWFWGITGNNSYYNDTLE